jgi:hypothetical protein
LPDKWPAEHPDAPFHPARLGRGGQALSAGLVDEVAMDVVPVVLGEGVRFYGLALR